MSYDLQILPRQGVTWSATSLADALARSRLLRPLGATSWELRLANRSTASVDLNDHPEDGPVIEISTSQQLSEDGIAQLYTACAAVAAALDGVVYDPQGDTTYTPQELPSASRQGWSREDYLTLAEVAFGAMGFLVGWVWWLAGQPRNALWLGGALALFAVWLILYVRRKRHD